MNRFAIPAVFIVAALAYYLGIHLGFSNRIEYDVMGRHAQLAFGRQTLYDFFVLGCLVCLFGSIAAKFAKTGFLFVVVSATVIVLVDFIRRSVFGQWSLGFFQLFGYVHMFIAYFAGVFAVYGIGSFWARHWKPLIGQGNT